MKSSTYSLLGAGLMMLAAAVARADTVQLANGDLLHGKVVSLDEKQLQFESQSLGRIALPREKVAAIVLGERKLPTATPAAASPRAGQGAPAASNPQEPLSLEQILKQLQAEGAKPGQLNEIKDLKDLKQAIPLLASPEVQSYFNKTVGGLIDGSLTVQDIRKEAIHARDELKDVIKELGPEAGQALGMYMGILDRFIRETEPAAANALPGAAPPARSPGK